MKLNDNVLKKLINEVLTEKFSYDKWQDALGAATKIPKTQGTKRELSTRNVFDVLARIKDPNTTLDTEDLQLLIDNPDLVDTDIMRALYAAKSVATDEELKTMAQSALNSHFAAADAKSLETQTFSQPTIRTATGESGQWNDEIKSILDKVFSSPTLAKRIAKLTQISKRFYLASGALKAEKGMGRVKGGPVTSAAGLESGGGGPEARFDKAKVKALAELKAMPLREFINQVMLMEYFVELSKSFDAGSGANVFEWFLAMIAGGYITGKESGPGGGMGAVDFKYKMTSGAGQVTKRGSAKYYAQKSDIKQAVKGFEIGKNVDYVVALKKQGMEQIGQTSRGTSDPARLVAAEIFTPTIKRERDVGGRAQFKITYKNSAGKNTSQTVSAPPTGKLDFSDHLGPAVGVLFIADVPTESFRDMMYRATQDSLLNKKRELLKQFETFFSTLNNVDQQARLYNSNGNLDHASSVLSGLDQADDEFETLMSIYGDPRPTDPIAEAKENQDLEQIILDKLLKEGYIK